MKIISHRSYKLIVACPASSRRPAHFAASELKRYLEIIFGLKIGISERPSTDERFLLTLADKSNKANYPSGFRFDKRPDAFAVRSSDDHLSIAGGTEFGLLFGVYAFLRDTLGARFLQPFPGGEKIPRYRSFDTGEFLARRTPDLNIRSICSTENSAWYSDDEMALQIDWMAKNGFNYLTLYANFGWERLKDGVMRELGKRGMKMIIQLHSFELFLPRRLYERHPDYFPLIGGKRVGDFKVQRCCANPAAITTYARNARRWINAQPDIARLSIQHNDGAGWCECDVCKKLTPDECFARFFAPAARRIRRARPGMRLAHYIYSGRWDIAKSAKGIYRNTDIAFDTFCRCKWHRLTDSRSCSWKFFGVRGNDFLKRQLAGWSRRCDGALIVVDNTMLHGMWSSPVPNLKILADDLRFYKAHGADGWLLQGYLHSWRNYAPTLYVLSRLMWNPTLDCRREISSFFADLYGKAAGQIVSRFWLKLERQLPAERSCYPVTWGKLSPRDFDGILESITAAIKQAGSRQAARDLRRLEYTWKYLRQWAAGIRLDYKAMFLQDPFALVHKDKITLPAICPPLTKAELENKCSIQDSLAVLRFYLKLWRTMEKGGYGAIDSYYVRWLLAMRCWFVAGRHLLAPDAWARIRADRKRIVLPNVTGFKRPQDYIEHALNAKLVAGASIGTILADIDRGLAYEKRMIEALARKTNVYSKKGHV